MASPPPPAPPPAVAEEESALGEEEEVAETEATEEDPSAPEPEKRYRQTFSWRQLAILEQVFDRDPLPKLVSDAGAISRAARRDRDPLRCVAGRTQSARDEARQDATNHPGLVPEPQAEVEDHSEGAWRDAALAEDRVDASREP